MWNAQIITHIQKKINWAYALYLIVPFTLIYWATVYRDADTHEYQEVANDVNIELPIPEQSVRKERDKLKIIDLCFLSIDHQSMKWIRTARQSHENLLYFFVDPFAECSMWDMIYGFFVVPPV